MHYVFPHSIIWCSHLPFLQLHLAGLSGACILVHIFVIPFQNFPYKTCSRFDTSPKENSPWETYGFPWEKLCHRGRRRRLPRDLTSPKGKNKPNQHLPRNPQIKPSVRLPRDCHQTIPTSPKMINQTIFTSPKVKTPYHINISQGKNHTIFTSPKVKTIPSQHLPRNKTIRSLYLPGKKTKPTWHIPRKQNHTILTPSKLFKPNNHDISQEKKIIPWET